jgi:predicted HicB family RNase H-like nuclease
VADKFQKMAKLDAYEYDDEAKIFHGDVLGIKDVVTFQGSYIAKMLQTRL